MKNKILFAALLLGALGGPLGVSVGRAGDGVTDALDSLVGKRGADAILHVETAVEHTKQAVESGRAGNAAALVMHARAALENLDVANRDNDDNPHTIAAIRALRAAIADGEKRRARSATRHAEDALRLLAVDVHG